MEFDIECFGGLGASWLAFCLIRQAWRFYELFSFFDGLWVRASTSGVRVWRSNPDDEELDKSRNGLACKILCLRCGCVPTLIDTFATLSLKLA